MNLYLYDFHFDCGRSGDLTGMFVVDDRGKALLDTLVKSKREVYFGEVLGKHSEVYGSIEPGDVRVRDISQADIAAVARVMGWDVDPNGVPWQCISGFNPLQTLAEHTEIIYAWNIDTFAKACAGEDWE